MDDLINGLHESYYRLYIDTLEPPDLRVIVSLSSGCSSAVAAERALAKYGHDKVDLVFCDVQREDEDNWRFMDDLERRWNKPITWLFDGRDPLQVAEDEHIIPNQKLAKCSDRLKIEIMQRHVDNLQAAGCVVVMVIGFDWKDAQPRGINKQGRLPAPRRNWANRNVMVWYPLLDKPLELDSEATVRSWGIKPPVMYEQGYSHANCSGACVKQGKADWRRTLTYRPRLYAEYEAWERRQRTAQTAARLVRFKLVMNAKCYGILHLLDLKQYTFLRDERQGSSGNITLEALREETEAADAGQLRLFALTDDMGQVCGVECMAA